MTTLHVVRVFVDRPGGGNLLGIFLDGPAIPAADRQAVAHELGYSETVFVDDAAGGRVRIFTPGTELPFAGHPLVGTSWLLARHGHRLAALQAPAGEVPTWREGETTWIRGRGEWAPAMTYAQLASPAAVDALEGAPAGVDVYYAWAWESEADGLMRCRMFGPGVGIVEDEATGSGAIRMGAVLGRPLTIHQGRGSLLLVRPGPDGTAEVGGRCVLDAERPFRHGRV